MSRKIKNIISISLIIIFGLSTFFTIDCIRKKIDDSPNNIMNYNNKINNEEFSNNFNNNQNESYNRPNFNDSQNNNGSSDKKENYGNSFDRAEIRNDSSRPNIDNQRPNFKEEKNIDIKYYIVLGGEALIISTILIYLILSNFNKKIFKETFKDSDKLVIYILSVIIMTGILTICFTNLSKSSINIDNRRGQVEFNNQKNTDNNVNDTSTIQM